MNSVLCYIPDLCYNTSFNLRTVPHLQVVAMTSACVIAVAGGSPWSKGQWIWIHVSLLSCAFNNQRVQFLQLCNLTTIDLLMHGFCEQISSSAPWQSSWGTFTLLGTFSLLLVTGAAGDIVPSTLQRDEHDVHSVQLQVFSFRLAVETYIDLIITLLKFVPAFLTQFCVIL